MSRIKLIAIALSLGAFHLQASAQQHILEEIAACEQKAWMHHHDIQERGIKQPDADNRSDIRYCRIHWTVDPAVRFIQGSVMTVFVPAEPVNSLDFDFSAALTMDSVLYHGASLSFTREENILTVSFPSVVAVGAPDSLTFYYQGVPTSTGFGSFATNNHDGSPILWTLSEPYGAMEWWPCKQALNDKIDSLDVYITHPETYRAASNGTLVDEQVSGGLKTTHWRHRYPIPAYLVCLSVTNYVEYSDWVPAVNGDIRIQNFVYPESETAARAGTAAVVAQMQLYNDLFGEYPFRDEKYGHAQFGWGGGMEHQTMTFVGGWSFELLGHELAHHWFGDKVTCGSWQDIWLNEGFATYLSGLCYEHLQPEYWRNFIQTRINSVTSAPDGSVYVPDTSTVSRVFSGRLSYAKGAMLLHMLRWVCGETAFFTGIRQYLNDPALSYAYARTPDLKRHLEQAANRNLDEFFADWFYGEGYPSYKINWSVNSSNVVTIKVGQLQSHPSVSFFEMPLQMLLSDGTRDTTIVVYHTSNGQSFDVPCGFKPTELVFDPNLWILSRNNFVLSATPKAPYEIEVLPNPSPRDIHVQLELPAGDEAEVLLWQSDGKLVFRETRSLFQGLNELVLEGPDRASGWHRLEIRGKEWKAVKSVLIE